MGGGLKLANEELQHRMAAQRIREAEETGAQAIVTPCQTCCLGLMNGVKETGSRVRVLHLNDVVAAAVCPEISADKLRRRSRRPVRSVLAGPRVGLGLLRPCRAARWP